MPAPFFLPIRPSHLRLASDLHFDRPHGADLSRFPDILPPLPEDPSSILAIAGDVARRGWLQSPEGQAWLGSLSERFLAVVLARGNNEAWSGGGFLSDPMAESLSDFRSAPGAFPNVFALDGEILETENFALAVAALWPGYAHDPALLREALLREPGHEPFLDLESRGLPHDAPTPARLHREHLAAKALLLSGEWGAGKFRAAMTHYPPARESWPAEQFGDPRFEGFFPFAGGDFSPEIAASGLSLWMHGHSHHACDWRAGSCRVVSNPFAECFLPGCCSFDPLWRCELPR